MVSNCEKEVTDMETESSSLTQKNDDDILNEFFVAHATPTMEVDDVPSTSLSSSDCTSMNDALPVSEFDLQLSRSMEHSPAQVPTHSDGEVQEEIERKPKKKYRKKIPDDPDFLDPNDRCTRKKPDSYNLSSMMKAQMEQPRARKTPVVRRGKKFDATARRESNNFTASRRVSTPVAVVDRLEREVDIDEIVKRQLPLPDEMEPSPRERVLTSKINELEVISGLPACGYRKFVDCMPDQKTVKVFSQLAKKYDTSSATDEVLQIAQVLRHLYNGLPLHVKKEWELRARKEFVERRRGNSSNSVWAFTAGKQRVKTEETTPATTKETDHFIRNETIKTEETYFGTTKETTPAKTEETVLNVTEEPAATVAEKTTLATIEETGAVITMEATPGTAKETTLATREETNPGTTEEITSTATKETTPTATEEVKSEPKSPNIDGENGDVSEMAMEDEQPSTSQTEVCLFTEALPECEVMFTQSATMRKNWERGRGKYVVRPNCCNMKVQWKHFNDIQEHMLQHHYTCHFYACHFCKVLTRSKEELLKHTGCEQFHNMMLDRVLTNVTEPLEMTVSYFYLHCPDCGLWLPCRANDDEKSRTWKLMATILDHHCCDSLVPVLVYMSTELESWQNARLHVNIIPEHARKFPHGCEKCNIDSFVSPQTMEEHFKCQHPEDNIRCSSGNCIDLKFGTALYYRQHVLVHHKHNASLIGDLVRNSRFYPPANDPKGLVMFGCGENAVPAVGGIPRDFSPMPFDAPINYVNHSEPLLEKKLRNAPILGYANWDDENTDDEGCEETQYRPDMGCEEVCYEELNDTPEQAEYRKILRDFFGEQNGKKIQNGDVIVDPRDVMKTLVAENSEEQAKKSLVLARSDFCEELINVFKIRTTLPVSACTELISGHLLTQPHWFCSGCKGLFNDENVNQPLHTCDPIQREMIFFPNQLPNEKLKCPNCPKLICSITGLRMHLFFEHDIFSEFIRSNPTEKLAQDMNIQTMAMLPYDSRTHNQRMADNMLGMKELCGRLKTLPKNQPRSKLHGLSQTSCRPIPAVVVRARVNQVHSVKKKAGEPLTPYMIGASGRTLCRFDYRPFPTIYDQTEHILNSHIISCHGCGQMYPTREFLGKHRIMSCTNKFIQFSLSMLDAHCGLCNLDMGLLAYYNHLVTKHVHLIRYESHTGKMLPEPVEISIQQQHLLSQTCETAETANVLKTNLVPVEPVASVVDLPGSSNDVIYIYKSPANVFERCYLCGYEASTELQLTQHLSRHQENFKFCPICRDDYPIKSHRHMETHLREHVTMRASMMMCNFCCKLIEGSRLSHLIYNCTQIRRCAICRIDISEPEELSKHWCSSHSEIFQRFGCSECRMYFWHIDDFRSHQCRLSLVPHDCTCGMRGFANRLAFFDHFNRHTYQKTGECLLCRKTFGSRSALLSHRLSHAVIKVYPEIRQMRVFDMNLIVSKDPSSYNKSDSTIQEDDGDVEVLSVTTTLKQTLPTSPQLDNHSVDASTSLEACVRYENADEAAANTGGAGLPGYVEEDDDTECVSELTTSKPMVVEETPVVTAVTDDAGDGEVAVVAEVQHQPGVLPYTVASAGRSKTIKCNLCSELFVTKRSAIDHEKIAHKNDAGGIIDDVLGVPLHGFSYLCRSCCVSFEDFLAHKYHSARHGSTIISCANCSSVAYNNTLARQHSSFHTTKDKILYGCGECKVMFRTEARLYDHLCNTHNMPLLFFCKVCSVASTSITPLMDHLKLRSSCYHEAQSRGYKCLEHMMGICPASLVHYQPKNLKEYKSRLEAEGENAKTVKPSDCSHRSFLTPLESVVACRDCFCTMPIVRFTAQEQYLSGGKSVDLSMRIDDSYAFPFSVSYSTPLKIPGKPAILGPFTHTSKIPTASHPPSVPVSRPTATVIATPNVSSRNPNSFISRSQYFKINRGISQNGAGTRQQVNSPAIVPAKASDVVVLSDDSGKEDFEVIGVKRVQEKSACISIGKNKFKCLVCNTEAPNLHVKKLHDMHLSSKRVFCLECATAFRSEVEFMKHYFVVHVHDMITKFKDIPDADLRHLRYELECPVEGCEKANMTSLLELRSHLGKEHTEQLPHKSGCCSARFASVELKEFHEKEHETYEAENAIEAQCCSLCGTTKQWNLEVDNGMRASHISTHGLNQYVMCRRCFVCFSKADDGEQKFLEHFATSHVTDKKCCLCPDAKFDTDGELMEDHSFHEHARDVHMICGYKSFNDKQRGQLIVKTNRLLQKFIGLV